MLKKLLISACVLISSVAQAELKELTVLNTGNKTGSYSIESGAYQQDLAKHYKIKYINPGQYCAAYSILKNITTPVIFAWASDIEAVGRDGQGCATVAFKDEQVLRYNQDTMFVCSVYAARKAADITSKGGKFKIGHTTPSFAFARTVGAINKSFGTDHRAVTYDGTGAIKTALINKEVDFGFFTSKWAKEIVAAGGACHYVMGPTRDDVPSILTLDPLNKYLNVGYDTLWLMFNADPATVAKLRQQIKALHTDTDSNIMKATKGTILTTYDMSAADVRKGWENAVSVMQK